MTGCRKPCAECPFSRKSEPGGTGGADPTVFIGQAFGPFLLPCHMDPNYEKDKRSPKNLQCAGAATFRTHVGVAHLMPGFLLTLPENKELVFSTPAELLAHHAGIPLEKAEHLMSIHNAVDLLQIEMRKLGVQIVIPEEWRNDPKRTTPSR